ncbi:MAG TPA: DUF3369 domain-containing protein [Spirochaetota bacterium]|mgnify:FL=1|nr:DUF3369 domain-containing protein [Spirochaetota bacterium]HOR45698.1 DUF3369 domain-containing protein [Spirochaetota bacterium]HPK57322.1 DUF3369 domain-containing protein [Spirochaetota bacterium]
MIASDDLISFADENEITVLPKQAEWKLLIVDDEKDVHKVTKLVLSGFEFAGRRLSLFSAYSAAEAMDFMNKNPDTAVALIDVVMEEEDSGLNLVQFIRENLGNHSVRVILRTGQPGQAPEHEVVLNYDINDYKAKTELTSEKLFTTVISAIRSYRDIMTIEKSKIGLEKIVTATADIFEIQSLKSFLNGILLQFVSILQFEDDAIYGKTSGISAESTGDGKIHIVAATGKYGKDSVDKSIDDILPPETLSMIHEAKKSKSHIYHGTKYVNYFSTKTGFDSILYLERNTPLDKWEKYMVDILCSNAATALENVCLNEQLENLVELRTVQLQAVNEELSLKNKSIKHELEMARKVQMALFPRVFPNNERCSFYGLYVPMQDLGGDFYDVFAIDEDNTAFAIVDVSGHGPSASLVTAMIKIFFNAKSAYGKTPAEIIDEIHQCILNTVGVSGIFATIFFGIININKMTLDYANAGHTPGILLRENEAIFLNSNATVAGVFKGAEYVTDTVKLEGGERIVLFTDGLVEARNTSDKMIGNDNFYKILSERNSLPIEEMCLKVFEDVSNYSKGIDADDDKTILITEIRKC